LEERFREDVDFLAVPGDAFWVAGLAVDLPEEAAPFDLLSAVFFLAVAGSGAPWKAAGRSGCQAKRNASSGIRTKPVARRGGCTIASLPNGRVGNPSRSMRLDE
jgi:hypothetical protein